MANNEPTRLDRIEQKIEELARRLDEDRRQRQGIRGIAQSNPSPAFTELSQKIAKLHKEAVQRLEVRKAAEQSAPNLWQAESEQHRALIRQKLEKLAEQKIAEQAKIDRLDRSFKTIRLLAWLSFTLIFCAATTVILTTVFEAGKP